MTGSPILTIQGLHFSYDSKAVLRGVDLTVERGEMLGLVGPNGAGKTTLLSIIGGVLRPGRGQLRLAGAELADLKPRDRARMVAMIPQNPMCPEVSPPWRWCLWAGTPTWVCSNGRGLPI